MSEAEEPQFQRRFDNDPSTVIESPNVQKCDEEIRAVWDDDMFARAKPEPFPTPSFPRPDCVLGVERGVSPTTFVPREIGSLPYSAICKVFYKRNNAPFAASGWIAHGNTGIKGIVTAGHVAYSQGTWATDFVVQRQYSDGQFAQQFTGKSAMVLAGLEEQYGFEDVLGRGGHHA